MNFVLVVVDFCHSLRVWECLCMYICVYGYVRLSVHADMCAFVRVCEFHVCFFSPSSYQTYNSAEKEKGF